MNSLKRCNKEKQCLTPVSCSHVWNSIHSLLQNDVEEVMFNLQFTVTFHISICCFTSILKSFIILVKKKLGDGPILTEVFSGKHRRLWTKVRSWPTYPPWVTLIDYSLKQSLILVYISVFSIASLQTCNNKTQFAAFGSFFKICCTRLGNTETMYFGQTNP